MQSVLRKKLESCRDAIVDRNKIQALSYTRLAACFLYYLSWDIDPIGWISKLANIGFCHRNVSSLLLPLSWLSLSKLGFFFRTCFNMFTNVNPFYFVAPICLKWRYLIKILSWRLNILLTVYVFLSAVIILVSIRFEAKANASGFDVIRIIECLALPVDPYCYPIPAWPALTKWPLHAAASTCRLQFCQHAPGHHVSWFVRLTPACELTRKPTLVPSCAVCRVAPVLRFYHIRRGEMHDEIFIQTEM